MHSSHPTIEVRCIPGGGGRMCKSRKVINLDVNRLIRGFKICRSRKTISELVRRFCGHFALIFLHDSNVRTLLSSLIEIKDSSLSITWVG